MMRSKDFHRILLPSILLAFSYCVFAVDDLEEYQCPFNIHVNRGQIIRAKESIRNGAKFLKHTVVNDATECYKLCCERDRCDLAQMQYMNSSNPLSYIRIEKVCYMFQCGRPSKCRFGEQDHYATISYERSVEKLLSLDGNHHEIPPKNAKSEYRPPEPKGDGEDEEDEDLGSKSYQPPPRQQAKETQQHKDLHSSWETKSEGRNSHFSKEMKEFGKSTYHSKSASKPTATKYFEVYGQPIYNEVAEKRPENPTTQGDRKTIGPVVSVEKVSDGHKQVQVPTHKDEYNTDAELEMKLEELTPTAKKPQHAKVTPATTFHHWRDFVDNNPKFPYTIPVKHEEATTKPTTEKWTVVARTEHPTSEIVATRKMVKTKPVKTTEKTTTEQTKRVTEKTKVTESRLQEDNPHGQIADTKPPILELPLPPKNGSDVVVIETRHLRIIENKAVLPLAIFLVLAILLLFVVALRLRIVKSKLKRRPFATDDADYLINGMYL